MATISVSNPQRQRPGGVTAVAVIAAVLGGLGLVTALWTVVASLLGMQTQANMFGSAGAMPAEQQAAYQEMMTDMEGVMNRWKPLIVPINLLAAVACAGMLVSGIGALRNRPAGRKLLVWFLLAGILTEIAWLATTLPMQMETNTVTQRSMSKLLKAGAPPGQPMPKQAEEITEMIMKVTMYFTLAIFTAWVVAKVLFFGFAARYLRRPHVLAFFSQREATDVVPLE